jgi:hypothetical protein
VHQPKTKFKLNMMQQFMSPLSFNIPKKRYTYHINNQNSMKKKRKEKSIEVRKEVTPEFGRY